MKLTSRERKLLGLLLALALLYIEFTFLLSGQMERVKTALEVKNEMDVRVERLKNAEVTEKELGTKIEKSLGAVKLVMDKYFTTTEQEELILLFNDLLTDSGVDVHAFVFGSPEEVMLDETAFKTMRVTLNFTSSYENLDKLMKKIWSFQKMLVINNVSLSKDQNGILSGNLDITCYYLSGYEGTGYVDKLYQIIPDDSFYKGNPFMSSAGAWDFRINYLYTGGKDPGEMAYVPFEDIKGHWAEKEINDFGAKNFLPQTQSKTFGPDTPMTRGEFIIMLDRIYQWPMPENPVDLQQFTDYAALGSYENSIAKAVYKGYLGGFVVGYSDNTLRPRDPMTYEEMEFVVQKLKNQPDFRWDQVAVKLKTEKGIDSPGVASKKATMTKAEAVFMMSGIQ